MIINYGTFGQGTMDSNSLVTNLMKYPSISSTLVELWPNYTLSGFLERTERYATNVTYADKRVQWFTTNRNRRASFIQSAAAPGGAATVTGPYVVWTVTFDPQQDYIFPNDVIDILGVNVFVKSKSGNVATVQIHSENSTVSLTIAQIANIQCGVTGTAYAEGSEGGSSVYGHPDLNDNYMSIQKRGFDITGSSYTDITWIENNGQRLWYFTRMQTFMDEWAYEKEIKRWKGTRTVTAAGAPTVFDNQGRPVYDGDGLLAQLDGALQGTYSATGITRAEIDNFVRMLRQQGSIEDGAEIMVWGGLAAKGMFHNAMAAAYEPNGNIVYSASGGAPIALGQHYSTYYSEGVKLTFALANIFDDPTVFGGQMVSSAALGGSYTRQSYDMIFVNVGKFGKGSNLEIAVKAEGGINRANVIKYIPGMIDPTNPSNLYAMSSSDKFGVQVLTESALILKNRNAAARLRVA